MARRMVYGGTWVLGALLAVVLFTFSRPASLQASGDPGELRALGVASEYFIPASAHAAGAVGTNWRTDVEVHNPGTTQAQYTFYLLRRDTVNSSPTSRTYSLGPGQCVRYTDILATAFSYSGSAALRVIVNSGQVMVNSRTFNALPDGTFGQFVRGQAAAEAIPYGQQGRLFHLTHNRSTSSGFRTNIGFVNATAGAIQIYVDLYLASGGYLGRVSRSLGAYEYQQVDKIFESVTGGDVADGYAIVTTPSVGGKFFAYASVVDNPKGDPVFVTAESFSGGTLPPPTTSPPPATHSPSPTIPPPTATPGTGSLAFRLVWSGVEDLDLHVREPNGTEIYYNNKGPTATGGRLDKDCNGPCSNQCASPIENVYWPTGGAPNGTYQFWVNFYDTCSGSASKSFTLYVYVNGSVYQTLNGSITGVGNNSQTYTHTQGGTSPTPTPGGIGGNLIPAKPSGWDYPVVPSSTTGTHTVGLLSAYYITYVDWAVANNGSAAIPGPIAFDLKLDGAVVTRFTYNGASLGAGYYTYYDDYQMNIDQVGNHSLAIVADPDNARTESNESDNAWSGTWEWTSIVYNSPAQAMAAARANARRGPVPVITISPDQVRRLDGADAPRAPLPPKR